MDFDERMKLLFSDMGMQVDPVILVEVEVEVEVEEVNA